MSQWIRYDTHVGDPVDTRNATLIPFSKALEIRFPGMGGGFLFNRPTSVLVVDAEGREEVLPIHNVTRIAVWSIYGLAAAAILMTWLANRKRK